MKTLNVLAFGAILVCFYPQTSEAESFMGFECRTNCSGHRAGYEWAKKRDVRIEPQCPLVGNRASFHEGCLAFVRGRAPEVKQIEGEIYPMPGYARGECLRPGTAINFQVEGDAIAEQLNSRSDFAPLQKALKDRYWTFGQMAVKGRKMIVLIHKSETRIMFDRKDGRGMAFVSENGNLTGVNDLICRVTFR